MSLSGIVLAPADVGLAATVVTWVEPIGQLWVNAIRMTVIPLLVSLLLGGIVSAGSGTVARIGGRTLAWFVGLIAATATLAGLTGPTLLRWVGAERVQLPESWGAAGTSDVTLPPFSEWLVGLIPANPVQAAAEGAILPLVIFTLLFGLAATRTSPEHREVIGRGARAVSATVLVIVEWILAVAPVGVFALTLSLGAQTGVAVIGAVAGFILVTGFLLAVATGALFPLVRAVTGIPFRLFGRACAPAQAVGFSTRSSLACLPVLMEEADETLHLPPEVSGLVLPAAVSIFKYGSPITRVVGTAFIASMFGVELGLVEWIVVVAGLGLLTFYSPGIPSGGLFVVAPLFQSLGLPLEGIGILIALDLVPDMFLTATNVTGNMAVAALVSGPVSARAQSGGGPEDSGPIS
jgi:proton glutamate symport protein